MLSHGSPKDSNAQIQIKEIHNIIEKEAGSSGDTGSVLCALIYDGVGKIQIQSKDHVIEIKPAVVVNVAADGVPADRRAARLYAHSRCHIVGDKGVLAA